MPHTSYALFKAIRSHRITSPSARRSRDQKVPNACNLCHIDRGLGWTAHFLSTWYGQPGLEPPAPERPGEAPRVVGFLVADVDADRVDAGDQARLPNVSAATAAHVQHARARLQT
jgi:hypothetical protein